MPEIKKTRSEKMSNRIEVRIGPSLDQRSRDMADKMGIDRSDLYRDGVELMIQLLSGNATFRFKDPSFLSKSQVLSKALASGLISKSAFVAEPVAEDVPTTPQNLEVAPSRGVARLSDDSAFSAELPSTTSALQPPGASQPPGENSRYRTPVPVATGAGVPSAAQEDVGQSTGVSPTELQMELHSLLQETRNSLRFRLLASLPGGPWKEAVDNGEWFSLPSPVAQELEASPGDVWVRADGQSMEGAGIPDGSFVLLRPVRAGRTPEDGKIVLVQIEDGSGAYFTTLKWWFAPNQAGELPTLRQGDGSDYEFPPDTRSAVPVALYKGLMRQGRSGSITSSMEST